MYLLAQRDLNPRFQQPLQFSNLSGWAGIRHYLRTEWVTIPLPLTYQINALPIELHSTISYFFMYFNMTVRTY